MFEGPHFGAAAKGTVRRAVTGAWPWALLCLWLIGAASGFWIFELRDQRQFEDTAMAQFDLPSRTRSAEDWYRRNLPVDESVVATVVHVSVAGCSCNRFTEPHLAKLVARYRPEHVRFVVVSRDGTTVPVSTAAGLTQYRIGGRHDLEWVAAAPSALVFNAHGGLVYFGPYSNAAWCGASGGLIERILDLLLAGRSPQQGFVSGGGCFCATPT